MPSMRHYLIYVAVLFFVEIPAQAAEFTINSWRLGIGINAGFPNIVGSSFNQVQSPFAASQSVALPNPPLSSVYATYDFEFDENAGLGRFLIESSMIADGVPTGTSIATVSSSSSIVVAPMVPITIAVHAEYAFNLPGDPLRTTFQFGSVGVNTGVIAFNELRIFSTTMGTGAGTFTIDGEFILPPTDSWELIALMNIQAFSGSQGHFGTGSGFFDIRIIPEPAALTLVIWPMLLLRRRRSLAT